MAIDIRNLPREVQDIIELREGIEQTFFRFVEFDYSDFFWAKLAERADPNVEHSILVSILGSQGVGKSMAAISMCCFMDPDFDIDRIFFNYNDLVYNRNKLKYNSAVLVDEQAEAFGLDSHRVNIILKSLKEQLRKKSIHFFFCAPVLYPEAQTSMYLLEMIFIDYKEKIAYGALKTREGLVLGHVKIPHPLKILEDGRSLASKELIDTYEAKKDAHLAKLLSGEQGDEFEQRAKVIMEHELFLKAEKVYKEKLGYIPGTMLIQIIDKIFPEFNAGVVPGEIAGRIKLSKEISGEWEIAGKSAKKEKDKQTAKKKSKLGRVKK